MLLYLCFNLIKAKFLIKRNDIDFWLLSNNKQLLTQLKQLKVIIYLLVIYINPSIIHCIYLLQYEKRYFLYFLSLCLQNTQTITITKSNKHLPIYLHIYLIISLYISIKQLNWQIFSS